MRRKECFFGLHFDYHANADTKDIGASFDPEILRKICREVQPDFIQCDTKGHPGYSSYFTKVGNPAPGLKNDLLQEWRKVTSEYNIPLFSHYSGIWDKKAMSSNPEWAIVNKEGKVGEGASTFGDYSNKLLIPQLKELAGSYEMNGAWVDGECWAYQLDYSPKSVEAFKKEYGLDPFNLKDKKEEKVWLKFNRQNFLKYVKHYIDEIHSDYPNFDITSNWLNSAWVPDNIGYTDFISGDLSPTNSIDSARFDGRVMASFGRNFDILSWAISFPIHYVKDSIQLKQEASIVMSLGGGYQIYNMQSPQEVVNDPWAIPMWRDVSLFCKKMKPFCHNSTPVNDVGVIYSVEAYYDCIDVPFFRDCSYNMELYGITLLLLDNGRSVNYINSQRIKDIDLSSYKFLFLSNATSIENDLKIALLNYVNNGGKVVLQGVDTVKLFKNDLKLKFGLENSDCKKLIGMIKGQNFYLETRKPYIEITDLNSLVSLDVCDVYGDIDCYNPPASISLRHQYISAFGKIKYGRGKFLLMPLNIGTAYLKDRTFEGQLFMKECLSYCPESDVIINKNGQVDINVTKKDDIIYIHLINLLGEHRSETVKTFNNIPPVTDLEIAIKANKPKAIKLQPDNKILDYKYVEGKIHIKLQKLDLYSIIEIDN